MPGSTTARTSPVDSSPESIGTPSSRGRTRSSTTSDASSFLATCEDPSLVDEPATFVALAQTSCATPASTPDLLDVADDGTATALSTPATTALRSRVDEVATSATKGPKRRGGRGKQAETDSKASISWTPKAGNALLRARFITHRHRFQGTRNAKQLAAAWKLVAAETFLVGELEVDPNQCKSKVKHMHKQFTDFRVALEATGNSTDKPLKEPPCYSLMCDVWGGHDGMDTNAFFSSDATENAAVENMASQFEEESSTDQDVPIDQNDFVEDGDGATGSGGQHGGWRRHSGKRNREKSEVAEAMRGIGAGLNNIVGSRM